MAGEVAALIVAGTGALGAAGAGFKFLWDKIEARFVAIDAKLAACEAREDAGKGLAATQLTVIELLWQEVERLSPDGSKALARALKLLGELKQGAD